MKVIAFNASPRKGGNTELLINKVFDVLHEHNIETELINFGKAKITGCIACGYCKKMQNLKCSQTDDPINEYIEKMVEVDGIILGSPVYFADVNSQAKAFIDRAGYVCRANGMVLKHKVGAGITAMRRAGGVQAFNTIYNFMHINEMIVPGASYWNLGIGSDINDVNSDEEGLNTMQTLGENMAWTLEKITK